ncbi:LytTR family DNA-binding domain-containing protein [uncultured Winogradskyella sp.]|uniref:LytTR family DNA-binding domain-containing protein n=1 Tax=uncultured Winogradskyella sp. TaxID=395353 RepID=UPI0026108549|nr:LytTR family DNA-binding domain-containing protein [uncultured Winogradskyella sp.]
MKRNYPFDPLLKNHILIGLLLAVWIFVFLYFTEPLDVNEFDESEKLIYLPIYGVIGALLYLLNLPFQYWLYKKYQNSWTLSSELIWLTVFILVSIIILRLYYLQFIVEWDPYAYGLVYHLKAILFPAILTILPIIIIGRFALGKYHEKRLEDKKVEIKGEGNYEGLRLLFNDIVSIQSSDNYIEVFYISGKELKKTLIRTKLSAIDDAFSELLRTHRSYVVNPFHFQQWKTENGKHFLILNYNIEVPISKTYLNAVKTTINSTTN